MYLTDLSSSLLTSTSRSFDGSSTIVGDDSWFQTFLHSDNCLVYANQCLAYCKDTCLRTVTYQTDPTGSDDYKLRVCNAERTCAEVDNTYWYEEEHTEVETLMQNSRADRLRYFAVTLPRGSYTTELVDSDGNLAWPTFVEEKYEDALCSDALEDGSVDLFVPTVQVAECESLVRNGDAEYSQTDHTYWLHRHGGISLLAGRGIGGSNAFGQVDSTRADRDAIVQYLDVRCLDLMRGRQYEVVAFVRLEDASSGEAIICSPSAESHCPEVGVYWQSSEGSWSREDVTTVVATASSDPSGYQRLHGILDVTDEVADASSVLIYLRRHVEGTDMFVDNVSMTLVSHHDGGCDNLVFNGDFAVGDSRFWFDGDDNALALLSPGSAGSSGYALTSFEGNMEQYIQTGCMKVGTWYAAEAKFKLIGADGREFACLKRRATDRTRCPVMQFRVQVNGDQDTDTVARIAGDPTDKDWNTLLGGFEANEDFANAKSIRLQFVSSCGHVEVTACNLLY